jgi:hypothetical protein
MREKVLSIGLSQASLLSFHQWIFLEIKGSRKNKFAFLSVKAPAWQGAKAQ